MRFEFVCLTDWHRIQCGIDFLTGMKTFLLGYCHSPYSLLAETVNWRWEISQNLVKLLLSSCIVSKVGWEQLGLQNKNLSTTTSHSLLLLLLLCTFDLRIQPEVNTEELFDRGVGGKQVHSSIKWYQTFNNRLSLDFFPLFFPSPLYFQMTLSQVDKILCQMINQHWGTLAETFLFPLLYLFLFTNSS